MKKILYQYQLINQGGSDKEVGYLSYLTDVPWGLFSPPERVQSNQQRNIFLNPLNISHFITAWAIKTLSVSTANDCLHKQDDLRITTVVF